MFPAAVVSVTLLGAFFQFVFQCLNINAARTTGRQLAVDHDCRNGSNTELFGAYKRSCVRHVVDDDLGRRTRLSPHYVNYLMAEGASRAEYFHLALAVHDAPRAKKNNGRTAARQHYLRISDIPQRANKLIACATYA